jgi:hypothetical protein
MSCVTTPVSVRLRSTRGRSSTNTHRRLTLIKAAEYREWGVCRVSMVGTVVYPGHPTAGSEDMGPRIAQKGSSYLWYPGRGRDRCFLQRTAAESHTPYIQAQLIFAAKDVPKKHDIPFAINSE